MAFLRSLFSGVSGLRNHQTMMDVIGNNIANVNTVGFKRGRVTFSEVYAQTLRGAGRPFGENGGTNPIQVGLGMSVSTVDTLFNQGTIETTDRPTDLAVQGIGFFVVNKDGRTMYTRDGSFSFDLSGRLVNPSTGAVVQGLLADANGGIPAGIRLEDIIINQDVTSPAKATENITFGGNLDASAEPYSAGPPATGGIVNSSVSVFDSLGNQIPLTLTFTKTGSNAWSWTASTTDASTGAQTQVGSGVVTFNPDGSLLSATGTNLSFASTTGAEPMDVALDFGTPGGLGGITQTANRSLVTSRDQDGYSSGKLKEISIDAAGRVLGSFTNDKVQTLAQIMLAEFNNPGGLVRVGGNMYDITGNSGSPAIVSAGQTSSIVPGSLEQSNVDLGDEFTKMITAQRGFQASARVITTSDEFLQEIVNLKR